MPCGDVHQSVTDARVEILCLYLNVYMIYVYMCFKGNFKWFMALLVL